jgi:hypothetical protein
MTADRERPDVRLLAELDAGLLDEATAREVRAAAEADPASRAVLDALAATRAELAAQPDPPVPPALAERWSAALAAEQSRLSAPTPPTPQQPAHPPSAAAAAPTQPGAARSTPHSHALEPADVEPRADSEPGPPTAGHRAVPDTRSSPEGARRDSPSRPPRNPVRRPGRWLRRPAVLAAALLIAVGVGAALRARPEPPPTVERPQLVAEALSTVGVRDTAGLADPIRRAGCLRAVGAPVESPEAPLLGGRRVTFEGGEGVLLVLGTGRRGVFDVLIVDTDCGPSGGTLSAATRVTPP